MAAKKHTPISESIEKQFKFLKNKTRVIWITLIAASFLLGIRSLIRLEIGWTIAEFLVAIILFVLLAILEIRDSVKYSVKEFFYALKDIRYKFSSILIFDALFYAVIIFFFMKFSMILNNLVVTFNTDINEASPESLVMLKSMAFEGIMVFLGYFAVFVLSWVFLKGTVWALTNQKKLSWSYYGKFAFLSLWWGIVLALVSFILFKIISPMVMAYVGALVLLIYAYFTIFVFGNHDYSGWKSFSSIWNNIKEGTMMFPKMIMPIIVVALVYFIITLLSFPLIFLGRDVNALVLLILTFIMINYTRQYFVNFVIKNG